MEQTAFNPAQMKILHLMSFVKSNEELDDLGRVISKYFAEKLDNDMDKFCAEEGITQATIEAWGNEHMRTPYK